MKPKYKYIFVVLVYKNIDVLEDFFKSLHVIDSHVIVVNSFYDSKSLSRCKSVALSNKADFISVENKGFGYGNNVGVEYAMKNYLFEYLILSNSDIQINDISYLDKMRYSFPVVIAPHTHLINGKVQNPNIPWKPIFLLPLLNFAYKHNSKILLLIPHAFTRISRVLFLMLEKIFGKIQYNIYSCHGSFIIFTYEAVIKLNPFFNEKMFLYNEELYLAEKCRIRKIPIFYCPKIDVLHLEGASSSNNKDIGFKYNKQSFEILYDWIKKNSSINN